MTREEAITNLETIRVGFVVPITEEQVKLIDDTFDIAIKVLEQEPCDDAISATGKRGTGMTKEQKDKILKLIAEDRNDYARDCNRRIAEENGKIKGADYMLQRLLDILKMESEDKDGK